MSNSNNVYLESLDLAQSTVEIDAVIALVGSMVVNKKLNHLNIGKSWSQTLIPFHGSFSRTLSAVVRVNTTLLHFDFPKVVFNGTDMVEFFGKLVNGKSRLKTINFFNCVMDSDSFIALGRGLERENIALDCIALPFIGEFSTESVKAFVASLKRVHRRFKAKFEHDRTIDKEMLTLLLDAAMENKNLLDFGISGKETTVPIINTDIREKIEFHLKLNRFGRDLFGSPCSMCSSLWPIILAPMASDKDGPDALFYSLCHYFSASKPEQTPQESGHSPPAAKRARH